MNPERLVDQSELLIVAMGRWPSFHDAVVLDIERSSTECQATIHVFEMTDEVDASGYFVLRRHHLVSLRMTGVSSNTLPIEHPGDVLSSLEFSANAGQIRVDFESHMDLAGSVLCDHVKVERVDPCDATGRVG